jgi:hypothetical protein
VTPVAHLSEEERQAVADGTLVAPPHLATCAACAADVARLAAVVARARAWEAAAPPAEDSWPSIRARIDGAKVERLDATVSATDARLRRHPWLALASVGLAAALLLAALVEMQSVRVQRAPAGVSSAEVSFASIADSSHAYEAEANVLLNELEMQRAMLRPNTSAALDSDLAVIDRSIGELKAAIARDPKNLELQRLLAASYREKVQLLRRASNAG